MSHVTLSDGGKLSSMEQDRVSPIDEATFRWRLLYDVVKALSAEPSEQIRFALGSVDELGLCFDDAYQPLNTLQNRYAIRFSDDSLRDLGELDDLLTAMSGSTNSDLWTVDALSRSERWTTVRTKARETLERFPQPPRPAE